MGSLVDLFYPDNKNRLNRVNDLTADCNGFQREIISQKTEFDQLIEETNEKIKEKYKALHKQANFEKIKLSDGTIIGEVVGGILSIFASSAVVYSMNIAWKSWMLKEGRIGEAALVKLIGYPRWFKIARVGAAIVIVLGLDAIVTAISGAAQREELRKAIRGSFDVRKKLYKVLMANKFVLNQLRSINDMLDLFTSLSVKEFEERIDITVAKTQKKIDELTDTYIDKLLNERDRDTNSWTNEDTEANSICLCAEVAETLNDVTYLDGSLVRAYNTPQVYLILEGKRCHIPNSTVYDILFEDWNSIHNIEKSFLETMPLGDSLSHDACLIENADGIIYLCSNGEKRRIRSVSDFNQAGFARSKVKKLSQDQFSKLKTAKDFIVAEW